MRAKTDGTTLMRYIRIFSELSNQLRYASQKRVLVEVALIKLTRPSMETKPGCHPAAIGRSWKPRWKIWRPGAWPSRWAVLWTQVARLQEHGGGPEPPGAMGNSGAGRPGAYAPGLQADPGAAPRNPRRSSSLAQLEDLKLVRNEWAKMVRSMGGGARSYLRILWWSLGGKLPDHRVYGSHELRYG